MRDNFSDASSKTSRRNEYFAWRERQLEDSIQSSTRDCEVLIAAAKLLPKLQEIGIEGFPCTERPIFIPGIEDTFQAPLGFSELMFVLGAVKSNRSTTLDSLCLRNIDQGTFGPAAGSAWDVFSGE